MTAHPGAFCSPAGVTGATRTGTEMVCNVTKPGERARWRRNGPAPARTPRTRAATQPTAALPAVDVGINPVAAAAPETAAPSLRDQILAVYQELATRPGAPVGLEKIRERLNAGRPDVDRALLGLDDDRVVQLEPDPDRMGLTTEARAAAINMSGRTLHLLVGLTRYE